MVSVEFKSLSKPPELPDDLKKVFVFVRSNCFFFFSAKCRGFFHDEIEIPERVTILVIRLSGKAAIKRGQTRTRSQYAEHKQVRQCQAAYKQDYC